MSVCVTTAIFLYKGEAAEQLEWASLFGDPSRGDSCVVDVGPFSSVASPRFMFIGLLGDRN